MYWLLVIIAAALTSIVAKLAGDRANPYRIFGLTVRPTAVEGSIVFVGVLLSVIVSTHYNGIEARRARDSLRSIIEEESAKTVSMLQLIADSLRTLKLTQPEEMPLAIAHFEASVIRKYGPLPRATDQRPGNPALSPSLDHVRGTSPLSPDNANSESTARKLQQDTNADHGKRPNDPVGNSNTLARRSSVTQKADGSVTVHADLRNLKLRFAMPFPDAGDIRGFSISHTDYGQWIQIPFDTGTAIMSNLNEAGFVPVGSSEAIGIDTNIAFRFQIHLQYRKDIYRFSVQQGFYWNDGTLLKIPIDVADRVRSMVLR